MAMCGQPWLAVCPATATIVGSSPSSQDLAGRLGQADGLLVAVLGLPVPRYPRAARYLRQAIGVAMNGAGEILLATGQHAQALTSHQAALALASQTGDRYEQARAHHGLARACHATGQHDAEREHWEQALAGYTSLSVPEADELRTVAKLPALPE